MKKAINAILICMLSIEILMILIWILAVLGISPVPANVLPMQIVALITSLIMTGVIYAIHNKNNKQEN